MQPYGDVWKCVLEELSKSFTKTAFGVWFNDLELVNLTDTDAYLVTNSDYKRDILENKHIKAVSDSFKEVLGFPVDVHFFSKEKKEPDPALLGLANIREEPEDVIMPEISSKKDDGIFASGETVKPDDNSKNRYEYTFDNFIVGNSNKFAHAASLAVANNPATGYNPLFIHGPSGLGKTHLLCAITNQILRRDSSVNIIYVKGEDFMNQMIESIRRDSSAQFRAKYRKADVLLIDDIQFIAGKEGTQEEFFHTFNALYEEHKQIIMTSDRPPRDIKTLEDRLKTRFECGLMADILPPDYELRIAIMKNKAEKSGLKIPYPVFEFLAENLRSNVRQLEGAVKKLGAQSFLTGVPITVELALSCISDMMSGSEPVTVTIDRIFEKVAKKYGVPIEEIKGRKRTKEIASARHATAYIIRKLTDMSLPSIGKALGRDHTTILSSIETIEKEVKENSLFEIEITELIKDIKENAEKN